MALTKVTSTFIDTISSTQILKSGAIAGDALSFDGPSESWKPKTPTTGGTVLSVALSSDGSIQLAGSPITASGTLGVSISSVALMDTRYTVLAFSTRELNALDEQSICSSI